jgi:two-component system, OmpR family, response regulator RpaA
LKNKNAFTTGQVATLAGVAPRTVSKWFDSGRLRGWLVPGSRDRRFHRDDVIAFFDGAGMAKQAAKLRNQLSLILYGTPPGLFAAIRDCHPIQADSEFTLGALFGVAPPAAALIDFSGVGASAGLRLGTVLSPRAASAGTLLLAALTDDYGPDGGRLKDAGFHAFLRPGYDAAAVAKVLAWWEARPAGSKPAVAPFDGGPPVALTA